MSLTPIVPDAIGLSLDQIIREVRSGLDAIWIKTAADGSESVKVDKFWDDWEIVNWINEGYRHYWQPLVMNFEGDLSRIIEFDLQPNVERYPLPRDLLKVNSILLGVGDKQWVPLSYRQSPTANINTASGVTQTLGLERFTYRFVGDEILFDPLPQGYRKVRMEYSCVPARLREPDDSPTEQFLVLWHGLLVVWAQIRGYMKNKADPSDLRTMKAEMETVFISMLENRSLFPQQIRPYGEDDGGLW